MKKTLASMLLFTTAVASATPARAVMTRDWRVAWPVPSDPYSGTIYVPPPRMTRHTVQLADWYGPMAPQKIGSGDREFDGNGPHVTLSAEMYMDYRRSMLGASLTMHAKETVSDWSEAWGRVFHTVYRAPAGKVICGWEGSGRSEAEFLSPPAGFEVFGPTQDLGALLQTVANFVEMGVLALGSLLKYGSADFDMGDVVVEARVDGADIAIQMAPFVGRDLVDRFTAVGDTGGNDISDDADPRNDTRLVSVTFLPKTVLLADSAADCEAPVDYCDPINWNSNCSQ